jgi:hypothetical protein
MIFDAQGNEMYISFKNFGRTAMNVSPWFLHKVFSAMNHSAASVSTQQLDPKLCIFYPDVYGPPTSPGATHSQVTAAGHHFY